MPVEIEVYTTEPCTFCIAAKALLKKRGLDYKEHLIFGNTPEWDAMRERTGGKSAPQIVINGEAIGGFRFTYQAPTLRHFTARFEPSYRFAARVRGSPPCGELPDRVISTPPTEIIT